MALSAKSDPLTVAVVPVAVFSAEKNFAPLGAAATVVMRTELGQVKSLQILPDDSIQYAFHKLNLGVGTALTLDHARQLGALLGAQAVVSTSYEQTKSNWLMRALILETATNNSILPFEEISPSFLHLLVASDREVLRRFEKVPTPEEQSVMAHVVPSSDAGLISFARGYATGHDARTLADAEEFYRASVSADPLFVLPLFPLIGNLIGEGRLREAQSELDRVAKQTPDLNYYHYLRGELLHQTNRESALNEFQLAIHDQPADMDSYVRIAEIYLELNKPSEAETNLETALRFSPFDAEIHAWLAAVYIQGGQREQAIAEVAEAERLNLGGDEVLEQALARDYVSLNDLPQALKHLQILLATWGALGDTNTALANIESEAKELELRLTSTPVEANPPRGYSKPELTNLLKSRLNETEYATLEFPLDATSEMNKWAATMTAGVDGDAQIARGLFTNLLERLHVTNEFAIRTARQVYGQWHEEGKNFSCEEYSYLYVALARSLGLKSFVVLVDRDYSGRMVSHACAGVFLGGKAWLVDPSYCWFGVPHQEYRFLSDLDVVTDFMLEKGVFTGNVEYYQLALKMEPEWPRSYFALADLYMENGRVTEAVDEFKQLSKLAPGSWMSYFGEGYIEARSGNWDAAVAKLRKCVELNPEYDNAQFYLATALQRAGDDRSALQEYKRFTAEAESGTDPRKLAEATRQIAILEYPTSTMPYSK